MSVIVNGLPLPTALVRLIDLGEWVSTRPRQERQYLGIGRGFLTLFSIKTMVEETGHYPVEETVMWLGKPDIRRQPGDIDMKRAVLIADMGHGYDQPIALDYRSAVEDPRLITLNWSDLGEDHNRWVTIDYSVETLLRLARDERPGTSLTD